MDERGARRALGVLAIAVALLAGACDEGVSATTTDPDAGAKWTQYCNDEAAQCSQMAADKTSCLDIGPCVAGAFRASVVDPLITCLRARPCGQSDDACFSEAASAYQNDPAVNSYVQMCLDKLGSCESAGTHISDDLCGNVGLVVPSILSQLTACLSHDCATVGQCLTSTIGAVGCN